MPKGSELKETEFLDKKKGKSLQRGKERRDSTLRSRTKKKEVGKKKETKTFLRVGSSRGNSSCGELSMLERGEEEELREFEKEEEDDRGAQLFPNPEGGFEKYGTKGG